jgi:hypothetical protein
MVKASTAWGSSMTRNGNAMRCDAMLYRPQSSRPWGISLASLPSALLSTPPPRFPAHSPSLLLSLLLPTSPYFSPLSLASTSISPCLASRRSPIAVSPCFDMTEPPHRAAPPPHRCAAHPEEDCEHPVRDVAPEYPPPPLTLRLGPSGASRPRPHECACASAHGTGSAMSEITGGE